MTTQLTIDRKKFVEEMFNIYKEPFKKNIASYIAGRNRKLRVPREKEVFYYDGVAEYAMRGFGIRVCPEFNFSEAIAFLKKSHLFVIAVLEFYGYFSLGDFGDDRIMLEAELSLYVHEEHNHEERADMFERLINGELKQEFEEIKAKLNAVLNKALYIPLTHERIFDMRKKSKHYFIRPIKKKKSAKKN